MATSYISYEQAETNLENDSNYTDFDSLKAENEAIWQEMSVSDHVDMYIGQGMSEKDALKAVAKDRGVSKRDIYNEYKI